MTEEIMVYKIPVSREKRIEMTKMKRKQYIYIYYALKISLNCDLLSSYCYYLKKSRYFKHLFFVFFTNKVKNHEGSVSHQHMTMLLYILLFMNVCVYTRDIAAHFDSQSQVFRREHCSLVAKDYV